MASICFSSADWGAGCGCCKVTFTVICNGSPVAGATVTVKNGATTVAAGTTNSSGTVTLDVGAAATYTVTASGSGGCSYSGSLALSCKGNYTLQCCSCPATICVTGCPSGSALAGATVTVTGKGTCTTVLSGGNACCTFAIGTSGSYAITVSAPGYQTYSGSRSLACGGTITIPLQPTTAPTTVAFGVTGCCGSALPGANVSLSNGQSATTDASGAASFTFGDGGTITWTVSKNRFATATGTISLGSCSSGGTVNQTVNLAPGSGYACGPKYEQDGVTLRPDPIPTTLSLTDSVYGGTTLNWTNDPSLSWAGIPCWTGTTTASFPGSCQCPAASFTIRYTFHGCGSGGGSGGGGTLGIAYNGCNWVQCGVGTAQEYCPSDPTGQNCTGHALQWQLNPCSTPATDGSNTGLSGGSDSYTVGDAHTTLAPGLPFDLSGTHAAFNCNDGTFHANLAWYNGVTITITE